MNAFLQDLLETKIRVKWNSQDELEMMAGLVDQQTGVIRGRQYMRGYAPKQYPYWGIGNEDDHYCLWSIQAAQTYTADEFISLFTSPDEQAIDITSLL